VSAFPSRRPRRATLWPRDTGKRQVVVRGRRTGGLRITGGALCNRRLRSPQGGARPTTDRVREAVFARLGDFSDAAVLDLYAGSGALGIEAISRGATRAVFVDRARDSLLALRANLEDLDLGDTTRVIAADVPAAIRRLGSAGERFDIVFLDPPYGSDEITRALPELLGSGVLESTATVVVESRRCDVLAVPPELVLLDERDYGDTRVARYVLATHEPVAGGPGET
jgi:16S rRNA (guanine966-N2)-methyltransferase